MEPVSQTAHACVPPEEVERRIAEYHRRSLERRAPAIIVYAPPHHPCPWPECDTLISGMDFELQELGSSRDVERWLVAWWQGPGLVGRCPGCGRYVLFGYHDKQAVTDPTASPGILLPDDWAQKACVAPRPRSPEARG
jgi:hypothetical protein